MAAEAADGEQGAVHGHWRNGGVDARTIRQARVHQRRRFVNPASHARYDFFDDAEQVRVVFEFHRRAVQLAAAFHVDQVRGGDQNVADGGVLQQRLQWAKPENFVQDFFDNPVLLHQAERSLLFLNELGHGGPDFRPHAFARHGRQRFQVDAIQQFAVQRELQLLVLGGRALPREEPIHPSAFPVLAGPRSVIHHGSHLGLPLTRTFLSEQCEALLAAGRGIFLIQIR